MNITPQKLPSDISILQGIVTKLLLENSLLNSENKSLSDQLRLLKKKMYGSSSEKLFTIVDQLELQLEDNKSVTAASELPLLKEEEKTKDKAKRKPLPSDLPREDVVIDPITQCSQCGGDNFRKIGDDVTEKLEVRPASFFVKRYIRPRCACVDCENIMQGELPSFAIPKGKAGSSLLAHVLVSKYADHLPLYRQSQIYQRDNLDISTSSLASMVGQCSRLLQPLIDNLRANIFSSSHIHGDDTPIRVLAKGAKKCKLGRIWVYVRDGRPCNSEQPPAACYYYTPDRKGIRPAEHLQGFKGVFHADAYPGYDKIYSDNPEILEAICWFHARRKFYEVAVIQPNATIACQAVEKIAKLYKIENYARGKSADERLKIRKEYSQPLVDELFEWMKSNRSKVPKKGKTYASITYALNNETAMRLFLEDGNVEIDNNAAERALRFIAIGRKNWMFAGSDAGGEMAANIYSLIETAKLNKVNPRKYLEYVLNHIQDHNSQKLEELLPWNVNLD